MAKNTKPTYKQPEGLPEGIFFGYPEEKYHLDPALSHSGMVDILESPLDYWMNSAALNKDKPIFKASPAMIFSKQCHKYLLEGKEFFKHYNVHGMRPDDKKQWLSKAEWQKIHDSVERIRMIPEGDDFFKHGIGEVTIVWRCRRTGIMLRARIDYLRKFGIIDYKRIRAITDSAIGNAICDQGLDIQDWHYSDGIQIIRSLLRQGKIKPWYAPGVPEVDPKWLKDFIDDSRCEFRFFFQRTDPPFIWEVVELDEDLKRSGQDWVYHAVNKYKFHIETYGPNEWPAGSGKVKTFELYNTPRRIHDRRA